jgi:hypothetical protein
MPRPLSNIDNTAHPYHPLEGCPVRTLVPAAPAGDPPGQPAPGPRRTRPTWARAAAITASLLAAMAAVVVVNPTAAFACTPEPFCEYAPPYVPPLLPATVTALMGDSFTGGEGAGNGVYPKTASGNEDLRHNSNYAAGALAWQYLETGRYRSPQFPTPDHTVFSAPLTTSWGYDTLQFLASSGATTDNLIHPQMDDNTVRSAPQLNGLNPLTNLIFWGFGGNDAHYATLLTTALEGYYAGNLRSDGDWRTYQRQTLNTKEDELLALMPQVTDHVATGLALTWQQAPNAKIIVLLYPQGLKISGNPDINNIAGTTLDAMHRFGDALNQAVLAGVNQFIQNHPVVAAQVRVFDPNTAGPGGTSLIAGHELGQPNSYFNGLKVRVTDIPSLGGFAAAQESFHPNQFEGVAVGRALASFVYAQFPTIFPNGPDFDHVITNPQPYADNPPTDPQFTAWAWDTTQKLCAAGIGDAGECAMLANPPNPGGSPGGSGGGIDPYNPPPPDPGYGDPSDPTGGAGYGGDPGGGGYGDGGGDGSGAGGGDGGGSSGECPDPGEMCWPDEPQE